MQLVPHPIGMNASTITAYGQPSPPALGGGPDLYAKAARRYPKPKRQPASDEGDDDDGGDDGDMVMGSLSDEDGVQSPGGTMRQKKRLLMMGDIQSL